MPRRGVPTFIFSALAASASAQTQYKVGDIVEDFSLIDRATNQPVNLYSMEGKVIFLEWFAHWCPFCQAAAGDIKPGIVDYYNQRGGNNHGVPVKHVGLNLQGGQEAQSGQFIQFYGIEQTLNDFNKTVANRFQTGGQPIFAIINGVQGSPGKPQWQLLYSALGYGSLNTPITTFRSAIDSVLAAEIPLTPLQAYLSQQGIPENSRGAMDDPDGDGIANVFEFLGRTNANDPGSGSAPASRVVVEGGKEYLAIEWMRDPSVTAHAVVAQFSSEPNFGSLDSSVMVSDIEMEAGLRRKLARSSTPIGEGSSFARLAAQ